MSLRFTYSMRKLPQNGNVLLTLLRCWWPSLTSRRKLKLSKRRRTPVLHFLQIYIRDHLTKYGKFLFRPNSLRRRLHSITCGPVMAESWCARTKKVNRSKLAHWMTCMSSTVDMCNRTQNHLLKPIAPSLPVLYIRKWSMVPQPLQWPDPQLQPNPSWTPGAPARQKVKRSTLQIILKPIIYLTFSNNFTIYFSITLARNLLIS